MEPYLRSTPEHVPSADAKIVFDRYHVMSRMGQAVDAVRKQEQRTLRAAAADLLPAQADDQTLAGALEHLQQAAGPPGAVPHPAPRGGAAGDERGRPEDRPQGQRLLQAEAPAGRRDGERAAPVLGAVAGAFAGVPAWAVLVAQPLVRAPEFVAAGAGARGVATGLPPPAAPARTAGGITRADPAVPPGRPVTAPPRS